MELYCSIETNLQSKIVPVLETLVMLFIFDKFWAFQSARRIADLEARLGARDFMEQSADQSADSKYRKLYRDEMRARERAESQLRRQEQMSLVSSPFLLTFYLQ